MSRELVDSYAIRVAIFELETYAHHMDCSTEKDWMKIPSSSSVVVKERLAASRDVLSFFGMVHESGDTFYIDRDHPLYDPRRSGLKML